MHTVRTLCDRLTVVCQAPLSKGLFQQEYWNALLFPLPGGSSQSRDQTHSSCTSCTGRQTLCHWATWEAHIWDYRMIKGPVLHKDITTLNVYLPEAKPDRAARRNSEPTIAAGDFNTPLSEINRHSGQKDQWGHGTQQHCRPTAYNRPLQTTSTAAGHIFFSGSQIIFTNKFKRNHTASTLRLQWN